MGCVFPSVLANAVVSSGQSSVGYFFPEHFLTPHQGAAHVTVICGCDSSALLLVLDSAPCILPVNVLLQKLGCVHLKCQRLHVAVASSRMCCEMPRSQLLLSEPGERGTYT